MVVVVFVHALLSSHLAFGPLRWLIAVRGGGLSSHTPQTHVFCCCVKKKRKTRGSFVSVVSGLAVALQMTASARLFFCFVVSCYST